MKLSNNNKKKKKAQRELRESKEVNGLKPSKQSSIPNRKSPYQTEEEERAARFEAVTGQAKVIRVLLPTLLKRLSNIPDPRQPKKIKHKLSVMMLYGILIFVFQMASRREANQEITRPVFMKNLRLLFPELKNLPHQDTLNRLLSVIDVEQIEDAYIELVRHLIRGKKFHRYLISNCHGVAIDGTQKFTRNTLWAEECLQRKVGSGPNKDTQYYVYTLEANLVFRQGMSLPLLTEFLTFNQGYEEGDKQDCELKAFKRLAGRLKKIFPRLAIMVLLDGLYPNGPVMELCRRNNWGYMIVLKDNVLPSVWEEVHGLKALQKENTANRIWGGRNQHFWWVNDIEYEFVHGKRKKIQQVHVVICEEKWQEIDRNSGEPILKKSRHAWISSQRLNKKNIHERCNLGARHRWCIETALLVEKRQGYQYEHCFSHNWNAMKGYHYLMRIGHALNTLVQLSCLLSEIIDQLGVRGFIKFCLTTLSGPWLDAEEVKTRIKAPFQLRLQ